jgi:hypothetical protein
MSSESTYFQLCIRVPEDGSTGSVIADWIQRVVPSRNLNWVAISDVDASGDSRPELDVDAHHVRVMETSALLSLVRRATQIVWASFFFCESEAQANALRGDESYEESTAKSIVVIRVVDATELHVIGREQVLQGVEKSLPAGASHTGSLDELEFPE